MDPYGILILLAVLTPFSLCILTLFSIFTAFFGAAGTMTPPELNGIAPKTLLAYRFLAWTFDLALFTAVFVLLYPLIIFDVSLLGSISSFFPLLSSWMIALLFLVGPLCFLMISAYSEYKTGQTPGKYLFYLRVVDRDGNKPSFRQALIRNIGRAFFTVFDVLGFLRAPHNQRLTEKVASTAVVPK